MKKRKNITAKVCLLLLFLAAIAMIVLPFQAWAQELDQDLDGISDMEESECLPIGNNTNLCINGDPLTPDLFIMLLKDPYYSLLSATLVDDLFKFISDEQDIFRINVHVIGLEDAPSQMISENQYAIALIENSTPNEGDLGTTQLGNVSEQISGYVFTQRIYNDVVEACSQMESCEVVNEQGEVLVELGPSQDPSHLEKIFNVYVKNVFAHEAFHGLGRVVPPDRKLDYHYPQLGYIMDHHMYYKRYNSQNKVTWFIQNKWAEADKPQFK